MSKNFSNDFISIADQSLISDIAIYRHTVFLESKFVGLASTVNCSNCLEIKDVGFLDQKSVKDLAQLYKSDSLLDKSLATAAINSVVNDPNLLSKTQRINIFEWIKTFGKDKRVSVIGGFPNVVELYEKNICKNLWVYELFPTREFEVGPDKYSEFLPISDIVLMTATTIINHSFEAMLDYSRNAFKVMVGPSTPMHPLLFDYGIDILAGSLVLEPKVAKRYLSQGASYREAKGLEFVILKK